MLIGHKVVEKYTAAVVVSVLGLFGFACMWEVSELMHGFERSTWILSVSVLAILLAKMYKYLVP